MAGDWIKMRNDLSEDPAVIEIAARLDLDEFAVVGRLHYLWAWADGQSRDGHARGVTSAWINRKVQRDGFAEVMCDVGWLHVSALGVTFPNFANHNGATAKTRALGSNRKQKERSKPDVKQDVPDLSRMDRDDSVTREEKRREEKKEETEDKPRKRSASIARPDDVAEQVWSDWVQLRKGKRATVSQTVVDEARAESQKAGMTLERFLTVWCARGSQGLSAEWLKPHERGNQQQSGETPYQRSMRERVAEFAPSIARQAPTANNVIDLEIFDVPSIARN